VWGVRIQQQVQFERAERQAGGQDCWVVMVTVVSQVRLGVYIV
jgi:hypothetical protein